MLSFRKKLMSQSQENFQTKRWKDRKTEGWTDPNSYDPSDTAKGLKCHFPVKMPKTMIDFDRVFC